MTKWKGRYAELEGILVSLPPQPLEETISTLLGELWTSYHRTTLDRLLSPQEMYSLHVEERMSPTNIGKHLQVPTPIIKFVLDYHNIESLDFRKERGRVSIPLSYRLILFLTGSLLGDGHLARFAVTAQYILVQKESCREYIDFVADLWRQAGYKVRIRLVRIRLKDHYPDRLYKAWRLTTQASIELLELHNAWYRKPTAEELQKDPRRKWIKVCPHNLYFHPFSVLIYFVEDGYMNKGNYVTDYKYRRTVKVDKRLSSLKLYTNGFPPEDRECLRSQFSSALGLREYDTNFSSDGIFRFRKQAALRVIDYMDDNHFECFFPKLNDKLVIPS